MSLLNDKIKNETDFVFETSFTVSLQKQVCIGFSEARGFYPAIRIHAKSNKLNISFILNEWIEFNDIISGVVSDRQKIRFNKQQHEYEICGGQCRLFVLDKKNVLVERNNVKLIFTARECQMLTNLFAVCKLRLMVFQNYNFLSFYSNYLEHVVSHNENVDLNSSFLMEGNINTNILQEIILKYKDHIVEDCELVRIYNHLNI